MRALRAEGDDALPARFTTQAELSSLMTFHPSTRLRRNTIATGAPGVSLLTSPIATHSLSFRAFGGKRRYTSAGAPSAVPISGPDRIDGADEKVTPVAVTSPCYGHTRR